MIGLLLGLPGLLMGLLKRGLGSLSSVDWAKAWPIIATFGCALFAFLWLHGRGELRHEHKLRVTAEASAAQWERQDKADVAAHLVTKQSLAAALAAIDDSNARVEAAHQQLVQQQRFWQDKDAENVAKFKATAAGVAQLEASARDGSRKPCLVSDAAKRALEGL